MPTKDEGKTEKEKAIEVAMTEIRWTEFQDLESTIEKVLNDVWDRAQNTIINYILEGDNLESFEKMQKKLSALKNK